MELRLKGKDALSTTSMAAFMRTHEDLLWLLQNEDIIPFIHIFKTKLETTPDDWFIGRIKELGVEGDILFGNLIRLFLHGMWDFEEKDRARAIKVVQKDFLENMQAVIDGEGEFEYLLPETWTALNNRIHFSLRNPDSTLAPEAVSEWISSASARPASNP